MEKIIITIIISITLYIHMKEIMNFIKKNNFDSYYYEKYKNIKNQSDDIEKIKSKINNQYELIKRIARRIPFTGEEWQQKLVQEELEELEANGTYERLDNIIQNHIAMEQMKKDKEIDEIIKNNSE